MNRRYYLEKAAAVLDETDWEQFTGARATRTGVTHFCPGSSPNISMIWSESSISSVERFHSKKPMLATFWALRSRASRSLRASSASTGSGS